MEAKSQAAWTAPNRKDTLLNGILLGAALIVVVYAMVSGSLEDVTPHTQMASLATAQQPV